MPLRWILFLLQCIKNDRWWCYLQCSRIVYFSNTVLKSWGCHWSWITKINCITISEQTEGEHCRILKENEKLIKQKIILEKAFVDMLLEKKIIEQKECHDVKRKLAHTGEDEAVTVLFTVNRFIFSTKRH